MTIVPRSATATPTNPTPKITSPGPVGGKVGLTAIVGGTVGTGVSEGPGVTGVVGVGVVVTGMVGVGVTGSVGVGVAGSVGVGVTGSVGVGVGDGTVQTLLVLQYPAAKTGCWGLVSSAE